MPTAEFSRDLQVPASLERCWEMLTDVQQIAGWISIVGQVKELEPLRSYTAVLEDQLGPFRLRADLDVEVAELKEHTFVRIRAQGEDRQVASRISLEVNLALERRDGGTRIAVQGGYEVTGKVATMGASMIRVKAQRILDDFFTAAADELT